MKVILYTVFLHKGISFLLPYVTHVWQDIPWKKKHFNGHEEIHFTFIDFFSCNINRGRRGSISTKDC